MLPLKLMVDLVLFYIEAAMEIEYPRITVVATVMHPLEEVLYPPPRATMVVIPPGKVLLMALQLLIVEKAIKILREWNSEHICPSYALIKAYMVTPLLDIQI